MENTGTLEENLANSQNHPTNITIFRCKDMIEDVRGDRAVGIFEYHTIMHDGPLTDCKLGTARNVMEYIFDGEHLTRGTVYIGVNEDTFHKISNKLAKAEGYADSVQIANQAFLKEYAEYQIINSQQQ